MMMSLFRRMRGMSMRSTFKFALGVQLRDTVTGFSGCAIGRADHLSGCNTYGLQPKVKDDGEWTIAQWFDEMRLVAVSEKAVRLDEREKKTGADSTPKATRSVG